MNIYWAIRKIRPNYEILGISKVRHPALGVNIIYSRPRKDDTDREFIPFDELPLPNWGVIIKKFRISKESYDVFDEKEHILKREKMKIMEDFIDIINNEEYITRLIQTPFMSVKDDMTYQDLFFETALYYITLENYEKAKMNELFRKRKFMEEFDNGKI